MNIDLSSDQQSVLDQLVAAGRFPSPGEAVAEGVRLLISRERLKQQIDLGIQQADAGDLVDHDTVFSQLRLMALEAAQGRAVHE